MSDPTPAEQAPPDQPAQEWPEAFTEDDIRLMQGLDTVLQAVVTEGAQAIARIAWAQRTAVVDVLLKLRTGTRLN